MANNSVELKLAGVARKTVVLPSLDATVLDLKAEIAKSSGLNGCRDLKLIVGGKRLQDDSKPLREYGVTASSRILVLGAHSAETQQAMSDQEARGREQQERAERLQRLKSAAEALAKRSGSNTIGREEHYDLTLENQHGDAIVLDKGDQESLIMGMSLQDKGKLFMKQVNFQAALDVLLLSEEAFNCCKSTIKDSADNEGLLMLDIVWCYFQLRDAASLGAATERLNKARLCLQRSHGPNLERIKVLHGDFSPELATYIRLELLEGVAAFYAGDKTKARAALDGAQAKLQRLQVSDDRLADLLGMGFTSSEATRGLRFSAGDTDRAISFIMEQQRLAQEREDKQRQERRLRREQRKYGTTPNGQRVDMQLLERLCLLGYDRPLASEALRQVNNDIQVALDVLSNPMANQALQQHLATVKQSSKKRPAPALDDADVASLVSMGFPESDARAALEHCTGAIDVVNAAMEHLFSMTAQADVSTADGRPMNPPVESEEPAGPSAGPHTDLSGGMSEGSPATSNEGSGRDEEMEGELTSAANSDPMAAYDVDITEEGQAIQEYMFLLNDWHA